MGILNSWDKLEIGNSLAFENSRKSLQDSRTIRKPWEVIFLGGPPKKTGFVLGKVNSFPRKLLKEFKSLLKFSNLAVHFSMEIPDEISWELGLGISNFEKLGIGIDLHGTQPSFHAFSIGSIPNKKTIH